MSFKMFVKSNKIELIGLFIAFLFYVFYIYTYYSTEVLFLASFMGDIQLVDNYLNGTLGFMDLFSKFGEHGLFGYNILLLMNASIFHYSSHFDMILNWINVLLLALLIFKSVLDSVDKKSLIYYFGIFILILYLFNVLQGTSATMETQVRLGLFFFVLSSYFIDKSLVSNKIDKNLYISILLIAFTINVFGTMYNFAGYPVIFLVSIFLIFKSKNKYLSARYILIAYTIALVAYIFEYGIIGAGNANKKSILEGILFWLDRPIEFMHGIAMYYGSAALGYATIADKVIPVRSYLYIGYVVLAINIVATVLYFNSKMYKKTYLPIFLQGYTFFVIILALIGRYPLANWEWGTNVWYQVHTKIGLVSVIWIIIYATTASKENLENRLRWFSFVALLILLIGLVFGTRNEIKRAPYARTWYQNIQKYMFVDVKNMPINQDGLTPLLVDKKTTELGLDILKAHKLSVFRDVSYTTKLEKNTPLLAGNIYSDGWISKNIKFMMNTLSGRLVAKFYIPNENFLPNKVTVLIDHKIYISEGLKKAGMYEFDAVVPSKKISLIEIKFEKGIIPQQVGLGNDQRELSAIVNQFYFK